MAKLGRKLKASTTLSSTSVPVQALKTGLREIANTPVDEMDIEDLIEDMPEEIDALFASHRSAAEVVRKLGPLLQASPLWHGTDAGIEAIVDRLYADWRGREAANGDAKRAPAAGRRSRVASAAVPTPGDHGDAPPSLSPIGLERAARRTVKTETSDAPATVGQTVVQVASMQQPQPDADDDGYESFGNAEHGALRAKAAAAVTTTPAASAGSTRQVTTEPGGRPYTTGALLTPAGNRTTTTTIAAGEPNSADGTPSATKPDQVRSEVTGAASGKSGMASAPPNNGPPRETMRPPGGDMRDRLSVPRGTTPAVPARSTAGMLDLRPGGRDPDPNRIGLPVSQPTQKPTLPGGQDP